MLKVDMGYTSLNEICRNRDVYGRQGATLDEEG